MNLFKRVANTLKYRIEIFKSAPDYVTEKWLYGLRKALRPYIQLSIWVTTKQGAKIFLGKDLIDEYILEDICVGMLERYFPGGLILNKGDLVLDVGGHHGLYSVELLARFPGINILCVEPDPEGIAIIQKHVKKNGANANIKIVPYAIGINNKEGFLTDNDDGSWGKTLESASSNNSVTVTVKTLSDILKNEKGSVKFIKSNCEGGEFDLIPQVIQLGLKPNLIILMVHPQRGNSVSLITALTEYGYQSKLVWDNEINPCWHFIKQN